MSLASLRNSVQCAVAVHTAVQPYTHIGSRTFWAENVFLLAFMLALPNWTSAMALKALPLFILVSRLWSVYRKSKLPASSITLLNGEVTMPPDTVLEMLLRLTKKAENPEDLALVLAKEWLTRHPKSGMYTANQIQGLCQFWSLRI